MVSSCDENFRYGLKEPPGVAYSYNDYALALYYDTLMERFLKINQILF
jgi:hypothetical protein